MEGTPKMQRRFSLSLNGRNIKKNICSLQPGNAVQKCSGSESNFTDTPRSPTLSNCTENNNYTPPHRKSNLHNRFDDSPRFLDASFSPTNLLSQTLTIDSPEVGWCWTNEASAATPDSAYAESSFASACSSTKTVMRLRSCTQRCEEHRKAKEREMCRAEKSRMDELLKNRCAKLQQTLLQNGTKQLKKRQEKRGNENHIHKQPIDLQEYKTIPSVKKDLCVNSSEPYSSASGPALKTQTAQLNENQPFNDFFNDSATDGLLIKATQQAEAEIAQQSKKTNSSATKDLEPTSSKRASLAAKGKRLSYYLNFLEDDSPEDWFQSLDEAVLEATKVKKPRISFQRYSSMPVGKTKTSTVLKETKFTNIKPISSKVSTNRDIEPTCNNESVSNDFKVRRHASSHTLSPVNSRSSASSDFFASHSRLCEDLIENILQAQYSRKCNTSRANFGFRRESHAYRGGGSADDVNTRISKARSSYLQLRKLRCSSSNKNN